MLAFNVCRINVYHIAPNSASRGRSWFPPVDTLLHSDGEGRCECGVCAKIAPMYNIEQVAALYELNAETARRWAFEFREFLSDSANPPDHRKRLLNPDDLAVFSLIAEMRQQGHVFTTIKDALREGKRGAMPATPSAVVPADKTRLAKLQADVNRLTEALQVSMNDVTHLEGRLEEVTADREALRRELRAAYEEIGQLKAGINRPPGE